MPERIEVTFLIDLDPVPGVFHTPTSARNVIQAVLLERFPHYLPVVVHPETDS